MKRRYANKVEGDYRQLRVDEEYFKGYVCNVLLKGVTKPLIVNNGISEVTIKDNDYEWFEVYPDNSNYAITIMFDNNHQLIEWYFDIAKSIGIDNGIPYEDDLYLDMIILPDGKKLVIDEDELQEALTNGDITQEDVDLAYATLAHLEEKYVNNLDELINLTNEFSQLFKSNVRIK